MEQVQWKISNQGNIRCYFLSTNAHIFRTICHILDTFLGQWLVSRWGIQGRLFVMDPWLADFPVWWFPLDLCLSMQQGTVLGWSFVEPANRKSTRTFSVRLNEMNILCICFSSQQLDRCIALPEVMREHHVIYSLRIIYNLIFPPYYRKPGLIALCYR